MSLLVLFLLMLGWNRAVGQSISISERNKARQMGRKENYSFESKLKRATEECSYIARKDDDSYKEELLQRIKSEINNRKVVKFYEEREEEKRRSKKYYENVEREVRNRVILPKLPRLTPQHPRDHVGRELGDEVVRPKLPPRRIQYPPLNFERRILRHPPRRTPSPEIPPASPFVLENPELSHQRHHVFKRSKDPSFFQGTFKDHNNCFSRCVFVRMELVDFEGFPSESHLRKALEDYIDNKRIRSAKIRRVYRCFDDIKKVAIDDSCIYSAKIFKCMKLDEQGSRS